MAHQLIIWEKIRGGVSPDIAQLWCLRFLSVTLRQWTSGTDTSQMCQSEDNQLPSWVCTSLNIVMCFSAQRTNIYTASILKRVKTKHILKCIFCEMWEKYVFECDFSCWFSFLKCQIKVEMGWNRLMNEPMDSWQGLEMAWSICLEDLVSSA